VPKIVLTQILIYFIIALFSVGWSYSFIGTAYWQSGNDQESLTFLLEARRIFCKSGKGRLKGVDRKICNILVKAGLNKIEIKKYKEDLEDTIKREIQGDYYKKQGNLKLAKEEFRKAKDISSSLMNIFVLDS
jgi:tetratricopeptide (TPR) repeat protein